MMCACADAKTLALVVEKEGVHGDTVTSVCFSRDGWRIASCGADKAIKLWGTCAE